MDGITQRYTQGGQRVLMVRALLALLGVVVGVCVILAGVVVAQYPLVRHEVTFVRSDPKAEQVLEFEPKYKTGDQRVRLTKHLLRQYTIDRMTINGQNDTERYEYLKHFMLDKKLTKFLSYMEKDGSPLKRLLTQDLRRIVDVKRVSKVPGAYQVRFDTRIKRQDTGQRTGDGGAYVATIEVEYREKAIQYDEAYINPFGMTVLSWSVAEVE